MRNVRLAILILLLPASVLADPSGHQRPDKFARSGKQLPVKSAAHGNPCAVYGPGFVRVEGTETCLQIGGSVSIGAGTSIGR
jgi:Porin subfamily